HVAPPSSDRYRPPSRGASTTANNRFGSDRDTSRPIRPSPSAAAGSPVVRGFQVSPPSVDLNSPLPGPCHAPFSHRPSPPPPAAWRPAARPPSTVSPSSGPTAGAIAPVFPSLYSPLPPVLPPSVVRNTPRSLFAP